MEHYLNKLALNKFLDDSRTYFSLNHPSAATPAGERRSAMRLIANRVATRRQACEQTGLPQTALACGS